MYSLIYTSCCSHMFASSRYIFNYQLLFLTPGISPRLANSLKQILHKSKYLKYPRLRPQRKQRRTTRDLYLGFFNALAITDCLAML